MVETVNTLVTLRMPNAVAMIYHPLHTKRYMKSTTTRQQLNSMSNIPFSMENPMNNWNIKYHMPLQFTAAFDSEQDFVDHMFIWLIYSNFGILLSVEELLKYEVRT